MERNLVRGAGERLRVIAYLSLQFEGRGSHFENQGLQCELGRIRGEAGSQIVGKGLGVAILDASA